MTSPAQTLVNELRAAMAAGGRSVAGMTADSRAVQAGDVFLAFPGDVHDGRNYIARAVEQGAAAVLWEPEGFTADSIQAPIQRAVPALRAQAPALVSAWWNAPSDALWMLGITGTNGKTSCSHWLAQAFSALGRKTAMIGTLGNGFPDALEGSSHTTPDAVTLQALLARYRDAKAYGAAMEVSSHALHQGRVEGVQFDVAVLTNLSRDHLDYHGDMDSYARAKAGLFDWPSLKCAVLNGDDPFGQTLAATLRQRGSRVIVYGLNAGDIRTRNLRMDAAGLGFDVITPQGEGRIQSALIGEFNVSNLLACLGALLASDVPLADAVRALSGVKPVAGRMQKLGGADEPAIVVDYAHTPDALEKTLQTLRPLVSGSLCCVFGCGGGRDKGKRPLMGGIAARLADQVVVTSDNPRNEAPEDIIDDILSGIPEAAAPITVQVDRARAIRAAVSNAHAGDIVLIAGKGHEDYQEVHGERLPFSDIHIASAALAAKKESGHVAA